MSSTPFVTTTPLTDTIAPLGVTSSVFGATGINGPIGITGATAGTDSTAAQLQAVMNALGFTKSL